MIKNKKISILTSLYNCENFLQDYFNALIKIEGKEQIEVLLLHNAPKEKELAIITQNLPLFDFVRHIIIPERETLYRTWNRGVLLSEGEYITVWNVDDVRFPRSVLQQAQALDENPQAAIAYGDIWFADQYGVCGTVKNNSPVYNSATQKCFLKEYHISCFQMWRKSIHQTIGYYDEQLQCIADFDFQIRAALHFPFVKTDEILGIYLAKGAHKISFNGQQLLEYNVVYTRYGIYRNLNFFLLPQSNRKYQCNRMLFFNEWHEFTEKISSNIFNIVGGLVIATFSSLFVLFKQIVKKQLLRNKIIKNLKINQRQKKIRDLEWSVIQDVLKKINGNFLDVGTGTGYAMYQAEKMGFNVYGIEPYLNEDGVSDPELVHIVDKIQQACAENIPFSDRFFQIVYASHSLEHFQDIHKGLVEMKRVLDDEGLAIVVVPTGFMAFINLISQYIFQTHRRIARFFFKETTLKNFRHIFVPNAHGTQNVTVAGEIMDFRVKKWEKLIESYFRVEQILLPCLYPYPDFPQFFPYIRNTKVSSSVIFICSKI